MTETDKAISTNLWYRTCKRPFDLLIAFVCLIIFSPVLIITAILIKLTSRGPLFFTQDRAGLHGKTIRPLKFRTMSASHQHDPNEIVPLNHSQITPIGKILRRLKIDELPQLINILTGDMSLIGPRPTIPEQVTLYDDFRRQRLLVRPGLTGLAQVHGNALISWDERILYDIAYVRSAGFFMEMGILLKTVLVVLAGEAKRIKQFSKSKYKNIVDVPDDYHQKNENN